MKKSEVVAKHIVNLINPSFIFAVEHKTIPKDELLTWLKSDHCTCIDDYKKRNLTDPECWYCVYGDYLIEAASTIKELQEEAARLQVEIDTMSDDNEALSKRIAELEENE